MQKAKPLTRQAAEKVKEGSVAATSVDGPRDEHDPDGEAVVDTPATSDDGSEDAKIEPEEDDDEDEDDDADAGEGSGGETDSGSEHQPGSDTEPSSSARARDKRRKARLSGHSTKSKQTPGAAAGWPRRPLRNPYCATSRPFRHSIRAEV